MPAVEDPVKDNSDYAIGYAYWPNHDALGGAPLVKATIAAPFPGIFGVAGAANDYHMAADGACVVHLVYVHREPGSILPSVFHRQIVYCEPDPTCYANCDNSTVAPVLNVGDFTCFVQQYSIATLLPSDQQITHYANCDHSTVTPAVNVGDFTCFLQKYAAGCGG